MTLPSISRFLRSLGILLPCLCLVSCLETAEPPPPFTESDVVTRRLQLPQQITGVLLNVDGRVFIKPGPTQQIEVTTLEPVTRRISTNVNTEGVWVIELTRNFDDLKDFTVNIETPDLNFLELRGNGDIRTTEAFDAGVIRAVLDGSGVIELQTDARKVLADLTGSGTMILGGGASELIVNLAGAGNIEAFDLPVSFANVNIPTSGSGDVEVAVTDTLFVEIAGSGNVRYRGEPIVDQKITGSGNVSLIN